MRFIKMHGSGNDYVFVEAQQLPLGVEIAALACRVSDRHYGVGADGLVVWRPSANAAIRMDVYNSDGTAAEVCGNALLCTAAWLDATGHGAAAGASLLIETASGLHAVEHGTWTASGAWQPLRVSLDGPRLEAALPVGWSETLETPRGPLAVVPVNVGNPHAVLFVSRLDEADVVALAADVAGSGRFRDGVNVEVVEVIDRGRARARVIERGSGETLACGSGACAIAVAMTATGRGGPRVAVDLAGGQLSVEWRGAKAALACGLGGDAGTLWLSGSAREVFTGTLSDSWLREA